MDYIDIKEYLLELPTPMFFVHSKSGRILFANRQAQTYGLSMNASFFGMLEDRAIFSKLVKSKESSTSIEKMVLKLNNAYYYAFMRLSHVVYGKDNALLFSVSSITQAAKQDRGQNIAQIVDIFSQTNSKKRIKDSLGVMAHSINAFCAALYEMRNNRYFIVDEWRERKSVCIPILSADFVYQTNVEMHRLKKLKRAGDALHVFYQKDHGTRGVIIFFFDDPINEAAREAIAEYARVYKTVTPDLPKNSHNVMVMKGLNSTEQGFVVWDAVTRVVLFENKAYRKLFFGIDTKQLSEQIGIHLPAQFRKIQKEEFVDAQGRYYYISHTSTRMNNRHIVTSMITDITKYKQAENTLNQMAKTDALTGLSNRRAGLDQLTRDYAMCKKHNKALTVCFADIDGLKYINDTYGHGAGDNMIKSVADILRSHMENIGSVCRLGGDEFVLIFPGLNKAQAMNITAQIDHAIANCLVGESEGVSISFGFKEAEYKKGETANTLISVADSDMYAKKRKKSAR